MKREKKSGMCQFRWQLKLNLISVLYLRNQRTRMYAFAVFSFDLDIWIRWKLNVWSCHWREIKMVDGWFAHGHLHCRRLCYHSMSIGVKTYFGNSLIFTFIRCAAQCLGINMKLGNRSPFSHHSLYHRRPATEVFGSTIEKYFIKELMLVWTRKLKEALQTTGLKAIYTLYNLGKSNHKTVTMRSLPNVNANNSRKNKEMFPSFGCIWI